MADGKDESARDDPAATPSEAAPDAPRADERQWGALAHVAVVLGLVLPVVGGPLGPFVVRVTKGKESRFVDANAVEALNFGILLAAAQLLVSAVSGTLLGVGGIGSLDALVRLLPLAITVAGLVLPGMAAMKANGGQPGTYPASMPRLVHAGDDGASAG